MHICDVTYSYTWNDSFISVTWVVRTCDMTRSYVWDDSFICVTWSIHTQDMTHSHVWHDPRTCVTSLIHMCDITHTYCNMTHPHVWHDTFIRVTSLAWTYSTRPILLKGPQACPPPPPFLQTQTGRRRRCGGFVAMSCAISSLVLGWWMVLRPSYTKLLHVRACTYIYAHTYAHAHARKHALANMRTRAHTHIHTYSHREWVRVCVQDRKRCRSVAHTHVCSMHFLSFVLRFLTHRHAKPPKHS